MKEQLTAVFQKVPFVEELPRANAQDDTLEEARSNLQEGSTRPRGEPCAGCVDKLSESQ